MEDNETMMNLGVWRMFVGWIGSQMRQWQAFCQHLQMQGRVPAMGPNCDQEEKRRQMMEWQQFVGEPLRA